MSDPTPTTPRSKIDLLIAGGLLLLVAIVFGQTLRHGFVGYDDPMYVTDNPIAQRGLTLEGFRWAFVHGAEANYWTPITFLSHMLDCQLYGNWPGGHHLTSVALHAINAVLLYFLLLKLSEARWMSAMVAALFAVHPLHVESVAWIAERKDLLSGMFFLLCLWAYVSYAQRGGAVRYALSLVLFALGLMSKPMLVTVPGVLLLIDCLPLKRQAHVRWGKLIVEKIPFVLMSLGIAVFAVVAQKQAGAMRTIEQFPLSFRITNAIVSYVRYVIKTLMPIDLAVFYPTPDRWSAAAIAGSLVLLIGITIAAIAWRRKVPDLLFGWLWFGGMLLPVIGLVQVGRQALADRYSYLPHIGLFIGIVALAVAMIPNRRVLTAVAVLTVLACAARSMDQVRHWRDTDTLFTHALAVTSENAVALNQVGNAHARQNDLPGAERLYRRALEIEPDYGMAHLNLGNLLVRRRDFASAADHYEAARRWRWELPRAQLGLAIARSGLRQYDLADQAFAEALKQSPWMADAELSWGLSFKERGDLEHAKDHLRAALSLNSNLELARRTLADIDAANPAISPATRVALNVEEKSGGHIIATPVD